MLYYPERIGISGTHGKSTVTAIFDLLLAQADIPHTTVSGAPLASGSPLRYSGDGVFLFEACEYRDSFLRMHPTVSVITNIELDHADYFRDGEHFYSSFEKWALLSEGAVLVGEGEYSSRLSSRLGRNVYVVGKTDECDFKYSSVEFSDTGMDFSVSFSHFSLGAFHISTLGEHNVRNAVFAVAYAHLSGISMDSVRLALSRFTGIGRRLELLGYISGRAIYYDYAHHPTEIRCTLLTLKKIYGHVSCIFRPHTYTRTAALFTDFAEALSLADSAVLLDIYPAREEPIEGITSSALAEKTGKSAIVCDRDNAVNYCLQNTDGAIVLMGAGEVDSVKRDFILRIQDENK